MQWINVSLDILAGRGLSPYEAGDIGTLFDWCEDPAAGSVHAMVHAGDFLVDVVEIEANAVHQPSKPGDEVVMVLGGVLELTDDVDAGVRGGGRVQRFTKGEIVFIPQGWAGIYRCLPAERPFLELAIVPHDYFIPAPLAPSGRSPLRIAMSDQAKERSFQKGRYAIDAQGSGSAWEGPFHNETEKIVIVTAGTLTLANGNAHDTFEVGSIVVLPRGVTGEGATGADYRALVLNWLE